MEALVLALLAIPGIAVLIAVSTLLNGWALHLLWAWFISPVFETIPAISIGQAIGLSMVVSFLTYHYHAEAKDTKGSGGLWLDYFSVLCLQFSLACLLSSLFRRKYEQPTHPPAPAGCHPTLWATVAASIAWHNRSQATDGASPTSAYRTTPSPQPVHCAGFSRFFGEGVAPWMRLTLYTSGR